MIDFNELQHLAEGSDNPHLQQNPHNRSNHYRHSIQTSHSDRNVSASHDLPSSQEIHREELLSRGSLQTAMSDRKRLARADRWLLSAVINDKNLSLELKPDAHVCERG